MQRRGRTDVNQPLIRSRAIAGAIAMALACASASAQTVWFVDDSASPNGNGLSWSQAFDDLHDALNAAQSGDSIWVAEGRYTPHNHATNPRASTFNIPGNVYLYGGFAGVETSLAQRAGAFERTLLDGDVGQVGERSDNCFHVVKMRGDTVPVESELNGFVICNGNAIGSGGGVGKGGGVSLDLGAGNSWGPSLRLVDCTLRDNLANKGAAVSALNLSHIKLKNSRVHDNHATDAGGGLYLATSALTSVNVEWARNSALVDGGGAMFFTSTAAIQTLVQNNVFRDNRASRGGAVKLHATDVTKGDAHFECCTFAFNSASRGGAIYVEQAFGAKPVLELYNSILWRNVASVGSQIRGSGQFVDVQYCDVQGGFAGEGVLAADPRFVDAAKRDLRISPGSPAADAGKTSLIGPDAMDLDGDSLLYERLPFDFENRPRFADDPAAPNLGVPAPGQPVVDLGAFES